VVKPRRRYDESEDDVRDKKAFRVCIYADELDRLLAAEAWTEHVTVFLLGSPSHKPILMQIQTLGPTNNCVLVTILMLDSGS